MNEREACYRRALKSFQELKKEQKSQGLCCSTLWQECGWARCHSCFSKLLRARMWVTATQAIADSKETPTGQQEGRKEDLWTIIQENSWWCGGKQWEILTVKDIFFISHHKHLTIMADLAKVLQKTGVKMLPQGSHPTTCTLEVHKHKHRNDVGVHSCYRTTLGSVGKCSGVCWEVFM